MAWRGLHLTNPRACRWPTDRSCLAGRRRRAAAAFEILPDRPRHAAGNTERRALSACMNAGIAIVSPMEHTPNGRTCPSTGSFRQAEVAHAG